MSKLTNLPENDLFKMNTPDEKSKKASPLNGGTSQDSLRDFMRASSTRGTEKKETPAGGYQSTIYKKPNAEESVQENAEVSSANPKPNPVIDYRKNVQRQVREQKKVGSALGFLVYGVLGVLLVFGALAGYGAYVIFGELRAQKATAEQIRGELTGQLETLQANLTQTQAALESQSKQANETIVALQGQLETQKAAFQNTLAIEKKNREASIRARENEIYELRQRVRRLENRY